jgi:hypothetical protein
MEMSESAEFLSEAGFKSAASRLRCSNGRMDFSDVAVNSYFASVVAAYLRQQLMKQRASLTVETVMSSPDKVQLLKQAQLLGYRTCLYFIATDDAEITDGRILETKTRQLPAWFDAVLQKSLQQARHDKRTAQMCGYGDTPGQRCLTRSGAAETAMLHRPRIAGLLPEPVEGQDDINRLIGCADSISG